jgi:hypothetical protein
VGPFDTSGWCKGGLTVGVAGDQAGLQPSAGLRAQPRAVAAPEWVQRRGRDRCSPAGILLVEPLGEHAAREALDHVEQPGRLARASYHSASVVWVGSKGSPNSSRVQLR